MLRLHFSSFRARKIKFKKHEEIVTATDIEMNKYITRALLKKFPDHDILSEEAKFIDNLGKETWYVDPLDGTTNFAFGFPEFATCLGLKDKEGVRVGAIGLPMADEVYYAEAGKGAWRNGKKIKVSKTKSIHKAMFLLCHGHSPSGRKKFHDLLNLLYKTRTGHLRMFSSAGIELSSIASGKADACIIADIHPWDVMAGILLIKEAGGKVTNWQGGDWTPNDQSMVASNGLMHNQIIKITKNIT